MTRCYSLALFAVCLLAPSVFAERYGSETTLTLQGAYYLVGSAPTTQTLPNGDKRTATTHTVIQISNSTILQAMKNRSLIPTLNGYRLVMVGHAHIADGVSWFATPNSGTPVPVPADLLALSVTDGPTNGQLVVGSNTILKSLNQQTHNAATLDLQGFTGTGMLTQTWTAKSVKNGATTETVELVASTGSFSGTIDASPSDSGVGSVNLKLTGAKTVDLTRYGMASDGSQGASNTYLGSITLSGGTLSLSRVDFTAVVSFTKTGTLTLTGGSASGLGNVNFSDTSTVMINTTTGGTAPGLIVDSSGNVTQFPTFGSTLPGTLIIVTSSGTHTYTHDSNGVWTLVTP